MSLISKLGQNAQLIDTQNHPKDPQLEVKVVSETQHIAENIVEISGKLGSISLETKEAIQKQIEAGFKEQVASSVQNGKKDADGSYVLYEASTGKNETFSMRMGNTKNISNMWKLKAHQVTPEGKVIETDVQPESSNALLFQITKDGKTSNLGCATEKAMYVPDGQGNLIVQYAQKTNSFATDNTPKISFPQNGDAANNADLYKPSEHNFANDVISPDNKQGNSLSSGLNFERQLNEESSISYTLSPNALNVEYTHEQANAVHQLGLTLGTKEANLSYTLNNTANNWFAEGSIDYNNEQKFAAQIKAGFSKGF